MTLVATNKTGLPPTRRACSNCGRLGHLATTCRRAPKYHNKVGIEVEGYWQYGEDGARWRDVEATAENWHMSGTEDGSLGHHTGHNSYEWRTRPGSLGEAINQLVAVYPDGTDSKVGMHVHVSFLEPSDLTALASPEFFQYFHEQWVAWGREHSVTGEFQRRLNGENDYCRKVDRYSFERYSAVERQSGRYWQLNFTAYANHGTLECRMLPMFRDARLGVMAVEKLLDIYETFLAEADERVYAKASCRRALVVGPSNALTGLTARTVDLPSLDVTPPIVSSVQEYLVEAPQEGFAIMPRTAVIGYLTNQGAL